MKQYKLITRTDLLKVNSKIFRGPITIEWFLLGNKDDGYRESMGLDKKQVQDLSKYFQTFPRNFQDIACQLCEENELYPAVAEYSQIPFEDEDIDVRPYIVLCKMARTKLRWDDFIESYIVDEAGKCVRHKFDHNLIGRVITPYEYSLVASLA